MKISLWKKIFCYPTYVRFKRIFEELEREGYDLFIGNIPAGSIGERQVQRYIKRTTKVAELFNQFQNK